jgi:hypothetical protein
MAVSLTDLMEKFRNRSIVLQSVAVGLFFFVVYGLYIHFLMGIPAYDATRTSLATAALFTSVHYLTSVVVLKGKEKAERREHAKGSRKGRRGP